MPFTIRFQRADGYVRFDVAGPPSLKNYFDLIELAARETLEHHDVLAMTDLRGVSGRLSFTDQFFIGDVVGQKLAHLQRLAIVVPDDPDSYNSPKVAVRKGLDFRSFTNEEDAIGWLLSARPPDH